jgi:hypothetical protein
MGPNLWISLVHNIPSCDTNMLPKVVFDKTAFVKFKISNILNKNIDEIDSKHSEIQRILKISRKTSARLM